MKQAFKPLGIAAAVAAVSYANVASAQPVVSSKNIGDLALVPYYTVAGGWITGIHIVNTSDSTQVVKFRFRRATDSMDALDFNIVMSPQDVYAGFLDDVDGTIQWSAEDTTCTVPETTNGVLEMPDIYRPDAETGYVEIIAMGQPEDEMEPIAVAAEHTGASATPALTPLDCTAVRSNFFNDGDVATMVRGVVDNETTYQTSAITALNGENEYVDSENVLKVSYFIRDNATGIEFGDNAVHIEDFLSEPSITNQRFGFFSGDLNGFDFPDLNGGVPETGTGGRGVYAQLRDSEVLGVGAIFNEWSANPANGVALNWVVTIPGQYTMLNIVQYVLDAMGEDAPTANGPFTWVNTIGANGAPVDNADCPTPSLTSATAPDCNFRDQPVELTFTAYNREEFVPTPEEGGLVVSPAPPGIIDQTFLPKETNVISFGGNTVFGAADADVTAELFQPFGWVIASVESRDDDEIAVCDFDFTADASSGFSNTAGDMLRDDITCVALSSDSQPPVIGFAAWARNVAANPDASYGRIIEHSYAS